MTPKGVLALAVFVVCLGLSFVAVIDAGEPGHTLDAISTPTLGAVIATLAAASIGVVVGNRLLGVQRREAAPDDDDDTPKNDNTPTD